MNNKIVSTKNTNAIFLAIVLVTGTIALSIPSFMVGAQAQEYYGMEKDYKKSDKKDVTVKSVKCNNVNVNVNGLELTVLPPTLANLLSSGDESERGAASYGSNGYGNGGSYGNGQSGSDGDFKFVCINNNNNTVIEAEEEPVPPIPPVDECPEAEEIEACLEEFLEQYPTLVAALESQAGLTVDINGEEVTLRSFADICLVLLESVTTYNEISPALFTILDEVLPPGAILFGELMDCIAQALDIPIES